MSGIDWLFSIIAMIYDTNSFIAAARSEAIFKYRIEPTSSSATVYILYIGQISRVFANSPGDRGSNPGRIILKTQRNVLDAAFLNTQHYKVRIKGKVEQSRKWSSALAYTSAL